MAVNVLIRMVADKCFCYTYSDKFNLIGYVSYCVEKKMTFACASDEVASKINFLS